MDDMDRKPGWRGECGRVDPQPPASVLRNEPLHRLFKAVHQGFLQRALHQMRAEGIADLYPGATSLLLHLDEEDGLTLSELARRCDLENSTLTPLVDELERHDLVRRVRAADDRRVVRLFLTERGHELAPRLHRMWLQLQETALLGITEEELSALHRVLGRIVGNLTGHPQSA
jgi:DNA-binding MarR family transcriptional regulator